MDDDMLVEHGKDTTQMWVKYEDCVQEIALTNADAQATIAALQARVKELEEWKHIVTGAGTDQESVIRLAAYEYTKIAVQCWKEANARLESQLTQRTAELERVRGLVKTYADAKIDFDDKRLQEDHHAWRERYNKLVEAENALLQHRQGMEG
jgi:hypothetical protein